MKKYWCKFLDSGGRVMSAETIEAQADADALAKASAIQTLVRCSGFEIRDGSRLVARAMPGRHGRLSFQPV